MKSNLSTWQSHLKRISHFLRCKGIWWHEDSDNYVFHVSDADPDYHKNPTLLHFWSNQVTDVFKRSQQCWQEVIDEEVELPTPMIRIFGESGDPVGTIHYPRHTVKGDSTNAEQMVIDSPTQISSEIPQNSCGPKHNIHVLQLLLQLHLSLCPTINYC